MNKLILIILAVMFAGSAQAAILCESLSGGSPYIPASLSVAATSNSCRNTNVVVTSALSAVQSNISSATVHAWPTDRALRVEKGGSIGNTTAFAIDGPFSAGNYQVFTGSGAVTFNSDVVNPNGWFAAGQTVTFNSKLTAAPALISSGMVMGSTATISTFYPEWWGAVNDGVTDSTVAIESAIAAAAQVIGLQLGTIVQFQTGTYLVSNTITLPTKVGIKGANGRGTKIALHADFADPYMFHAVNGTSSMFASWIHDVYIDARGKDLTAVIWSQAWQESCGLDNVVIQFDGTTQTGLLYTNGYGGATSLAIRNTEIFADSTYATDTGITVNQISVAGGFILDLKNVTIAGSVANPLSNAVVMDNDSLTAGVLHVEHCANGVLMSGYGSLRGDLISGSPSGVVDVITLGAGFLGKVNLSNILPNGATGQIVKNLVTSVSIPISFGALPAYIYPAVLSDNTAVAWVTFTGNTAGAEPLALTILNSYNVASVTRTATGTYSISFSRTMPTGTRVVTGTINLDSADGYWIASTGGTGSSETITVRRGGATAGALYSAQTVKVVIFGKQI